MTSTETFFYLDPDNNGQPAYTINSPILPGGGNSGSVAVSASSLSVSTASNSVFVAGWGDVGDEVCAYDAGNAAQNWCQKFSGNLTAQNSYITSSPVVSDPLGLVFVTDQSQSGVATSNLYALEVSNSGTVKWNVSLVPPGGNKWYSNSALPYGGSPAYDDSANNGSSKYLITVTPYSCYNSFGHGGPCGSATAIQVFNALNGSLVCSTYTTHMISQSSPEVVDGVIYVGTDDGYVLAYDETGCSAGTLNNIWMSSPQMLNPNTGQPDPLLGPPVLSYNRIHAVTESGSLYVWHHCDGPGACW